MTKQFGWFAYFLGWAAGMAGSGEVAAVCVVGGMVAHWRFWLLALPLGVTAFLVGFHWKA